MPDKATAPPNHGSPSDQPAPISRELSELPELKSVTVQISNEVVHLLSDQLYQSPLKAVEELVVNAYDAEATICRLYVPGSDVNAKPGNNMMGIFDDGRGMTSSEMQDLWHIGNSKKRNAESTDPKVRKQIGKFGIGKLATSTIGTSLTYVSKSVEGICTASLDFGLFRSNHQESPKPVSIAIRKISDWPTLSASPSISNLIAKCGIPAIELAGPHWTIALVEQLKPKASEIKLGRLEWVLSTAMPMGSTFSLYLNGEKISSQKDDYTDVVRFEVSDLPKERLESLNAKTGDNFFKDGDLIRSDTLKIGVRGVVRVTERTLPGKSDDLLRSHGFFVRVRGRLINEEEPFFGMTHLHHGTENRFNAQIFADDLDEVITAPREGVGSSLITKMFEALLQEIFVYARNEYDKAIEKAEKEEKRKKEHDRAFINPLLVERPVAAALARRAESSGAEADDTWFYTELPAKEKISSVVEKLYGPDRPRFVYSYTGLGKSNRLVRFNPENSTFTINSDHPFAAAYLDDHRARMFLEDFVTAETLLEIQLRAVGVDPKVIGEVLQGRDKLLSSLVRDHPYSYHAIAQALTDASDDEHDLELALVAAARALGFVAKHISGPGEPDGVARHTAYPGRSVALTLEAKSSADCPSLSAIDFAGLSEHRDRYKADGVLLIAPSYPGTAVKEDDSAAAYRAKQAKISCWTIANLAKLVKGAESRHFNAETIIQIVQSAFTPEEVSTAVEELFAEPPWDKQTLASAIITALEGMANVLTDMDRTVESVAAEIARDKRFPDIKRADIVKASTELAASSQGALAFDGSIYQVFASFDELRRRTEASTSDAFSPFRPGKFKSS
jgi:Histidine kinase-, DNA gyrase B-, and HSP90-like ATPase